ncbi:hypothetical protein [Calycomorphotria hydatis]|uniref:Uncharacterized protein n=1 Tax=Calycomorphotria hydatis TaxID=2528027 RepID=A0A517TEQ3_9PLAN|nr:hypothetical protein [Calycomorphotria hydatis]QDT66853.1 hypothetical protein V22_41250 [Calycomorphotria hydatis]
MSKIEAEIYASALILRQRLEAYANSCNDVVFQNFPHGCCGDTCQILGEYLKERGQGTWEYVCGWKDQQSHAWIEHDGIIADITADQFNESLAHVIVKRHSEFHTSFEISERHAALIGNPNDPRERKLWQIYEEISST